jgi:ribosomal protein S27AE
MVAFQHRDRGMIRSKVCFKCARELPVDEFYRHPAMADGHLNKCKFCAKKDVSEHRLQNIDRIRAYDRERALLPHRKQAAKLISDKWRSSDKRRNSAHLKAGRAIKAGILVRRPCVRCGNEKVHAHHEDYDKPLNVVWLCAPCHKSRHKEIDAGF